VKRIQSIFWAEICQSCHIGYSNLAHSSCRGLGIHLLQKIEKKKEKRKLYKK
jgi:hypothetical protein